MSPIFRKKTNNTRYRVDPDHFSMIGWLVFSFILMSLSMMMPQFATQSRTSILNAITPFVYAVTIPFQAIGASADNVMEIAQMRRENEKLRKENDLLLAWYHKAQKLEAENKKLNASNNRVEDAPLEFVTARIIMDQDQAFRKTALLAAGRDDNVYNNQAVLSEYALIGRVIEVGDDVSRVLMLTDANSRVPVMVEATNQQAILAGKNDAYPELLYIPRDVQLIKGQRIVTSGHGGFFPPNIPIGVVQTIGRDKYTVKLFAKFDKLSLVRVADYNINIALPVSPDKETIPRDTKGREKNSQLVIPEVSSDEGGVNGL